MPAPRTLLRRVFDRGLSPCGPTLAAAVLASVLPRVTAATPAAPAGAPCSLVVATVDTIFASELTHEDCDIVVNSGGALVVLGPHRFASVRVNSGGSLSCATLDSLTLTVSGDVTIASGARVHGDGRGYAPNTGPGAGGGGSLPAAASHGGRGGWTGTSPSGPTYGSFLAPSTPGSGGRTELVFGGRGGGVIRLAVGGVLRVDGSLSVRGDSAVASAPPWDPGGGAGGSLHLHVGALAGTGVLDAGGGRGTNQGGGGGGGRIALDYGTSSFTGAIRCTGGLGVSALAVGGAGTLWLHDRASGTHVLRVDNGALATLRAMELPDSHTVVPGALVVRAAGIVSGPLGRATSLHVQGDATIEATSALSWDGRGFGAGAGPGAGSGGSLPGGASHGGRGGWSGTAASGPTYDSFAAPVQMGSGGTTELIVGGRGGGALRLVVDGALVVDGDVTARGDSAQLVDAWDPGGGSGGSVWVTTASLAGAGRFDASGGNAPNLGGGGGGGRIAVESATSTFAGTFRAAGGAGASALATGGAGTIWRYDLSLSRGELLVDNAGLVTLRAAEMPDSVVAVNGDLRVSGGGIVSRALERPLALDVSGGVTVEADGAISMDGRGHAPASGPGAGGNGSLPSGGSHAGRGASTSNNVSGPTYGAFAAPLTMGSGGGTELNLGGRGGGAVRLVAGGALVMNGVMSARGDTAISTGATLDPGGGAGGSVWVSAASVSGAGRFDVSGGGAGNHGGAGGGGRIAIEYGASTFTGALRAMGGFGADSSLHGGAGTIWTRDTDEAAGELRVDAGGLAALSATELPDSFTAVPGSVRVRGRGLLAVAKQRRMHVVVERSVFVESDGALSVAGRGWPAMSGPGAGQAGSLPSGGSHAGRGGGGGTFNGSGPTYGDAAQPVDFGSGGGTELIVGGAGGGALRLVVTDTLRVDGTVNARGASPVATAGSTLDPGGGAGGSLWLEAAVVAGNGTLDASGGNGGNLGGGGGGGRVSLSTLCFDGFSSAQIRVGGGRGSSPAAGPGTLVPDFARGIAAGVVAVAGDARKHRQPISLGDDVFEDGDSLWAIVERGDVQLLEPLGVEISEPGVVAHDTSRTWAVVDSGTYVNTHVLHFDPPGAGGGRTRGSVTFDTIVLGVIVSRDSLVATDARLSAPGLVYPAAATRGAELGGAEADTIELSADRRTVTFSASVASGADEIRVITGVPLATCGEVADAPVVVAAPSRVMLAAPAPNPSRGPVALRFALPRAMPARLDVLDVAGRRVATLADGLHTAGEHAVSWRGGGARAGVYFARLSTPEGAVTRTVVRVE